MNPIQLSRPPIKEAIFDIRVDGEIDFADIKALGDAYASEQGLTKATSIRMGTVGVSISPDQPFTTHAQDGGTIGVRLEDEPTTRVVQFRKDGFTYSHTGSYDNWADFRESALAPASRFLALKGIERINRVALRYINVIQLPESPVDLDEYFPSAPKIPSALPQTTSGFFSRIVIPLPEDRLTAYVTQVLEESQEPLPSVILDIDIFRQLDLPPDGGGWVEIFETIRAWKNRVFFEFVTEKTVALYK